MFHSLLIGKVYDCQYALVTNYELIISYITLKVIIHFNFSCFTTLPPYKPVRLSSSAGSPLSPPVPDTNTSLYRLFLYYSKPLASLYRNKGYDFTITSSTAYDQKWVYGRNIYENIDYLVDTVFANYLSRPA